MSSPYKTPEEALAAFVCNYPDVKGFVVALSGGLDSCVLLHAMAALKPSLPVRVLHVNHRLSPNASQWQHHCEHLARAYNMEFLSEAVNVTARGEGLERAAREARYRVFQHHLRAGEMLLLAHHVDDQAETLMLRLLRGAGLRGLGAMPAVRALGEGLIGRPLLSCSRNDLHLYAQAHNLEWLDDESNQSPKFDRNFLRLRVLPHVAERWPQFAKRFGETAQLMQENEALLQEYASEDLQRAGRRRERLGESCALGYLKQLSSRRCNAALRAWIHSAGYALPERGQLAEVQNLVTAAEDAQPCITWNQYELRRFNQRIYLLPRLSAAALPAKSPLDGSWQPQALTQFPDGSTLTATRAAAGLRADRSYSLHLRQGGERAQPHSRAHSQKLKKLLQEYGLEPWLRDRIPLIFCGEELAAAGDLWVSRGYYVEGEDAWELSWRYSNGQPKQGFAPQRS